MSAKARKKTVMIHWGGMGVDAWLKLWEPNAAHHGAPSVGPRSVLGQQRQGLVHGWRKDLLVRLESQCPLSDVGTDPWCS